MKYVVLGQLVEEPTNDQEKLAQKTNGWKKIKVKEEYVLWNNCVSPSFAGGLYWFNKK